jgi:thiamine-phosphate pyrophosphorylase
VNAAAQILQAGARILQFRHKGFLSREAFGWLEKIAELAGAAGTTLVVNDRADLAKLFGAALHLGQDDLTPSAARRVVGPDTVVGSGPTDYLALGPIFGTITKENPDPTVGMDELRRLRPLSDRPVVAIGGITLANARQVIQAGDGAGADSVAVIRDLFPEDGNVQARTKQYLRLLTF